MYTNQWEEGDKAPYGDATKEWMLKHIAQLKPIFTEFEDVIDVVNAGFIGVWGEWYYTTYFGDPTAGDSDELTAQNVADRKEILDALLAAIPNSISVQIRYPHQKIRFYDSVPTTEAEMKQKNRKARSVYANSRQYLDTPSVHLTDLCPLTGHHNDCFLASSLDRGTYVNRSVEYPYMKDDTKYTVMGGETCALSEDEPLDRYKCPTATKELKELHFSYLNQDYHEGVIKSWKDDGCFDVIHRHLGYRLVLKKAILPNTLEQGGKFCFRLELENVGYAAPYKQKTLNIMLRHKTSGDLRSAGLDYDLKTWLPGNTITVDTSAYIPSDLPTGTYEVLLAIKDKLASAHSDYNILLANDNNVPERKKGLNNLKHDLTVRVAGTAGDSSCPVLTAVDAQPESKYDRISKAGETTTPQGGGSITVLVNYSAFLLVVLVSLLTAI
ncbi:hypothetical protein NP493_665g02036 [Ridgeia piscesae]|uniref:DUF4832 domain-containing protein n=1 Tax=Ridgeia piscesae TaxID=27915 RepID=A0AAD9NPV8_RIDPI|nr:hypothetical protein NP493_665g02036 [Ridgeia piscesae]